MPKFPRCPSTKNLNPAVLNCRKRSANCWRGIAGRNSASGWPAVCFFGHPGEPRRPCYSYSPYLLLTGPPYRCWSNATTQLAACRAASDPRVVAAGRHATPLTRAVRHGRRRRSARTDADSFPPRRGVRLPVSPRHDSSQSRLCPPRHGVGQPIRVAVLPM